MESVNTLKFDFSRDFLLSSTCEDLFQTVAIVARVLLLS